MTDIRLVEVDPSEIDLDQLDLVFDAISSPVNSSVETEDLVTESGRAPQQGLTIEPSQSLQESIQHVSEKLSRVRSILRTAIGIDL